MQSAPPLYKFLKIIQLKDIVFIQIALFMYDYISNNLPTAFSNYFKLSADAHTHNTRYTLHNLKLPAIRTNFGKFSLKFSGPKIWSSISNETKQLSRSLFIKTLKNNFLDLYE